MTPPNECCQKVIQVYLAHIEPEVFEQPGIALYCPECKSRVIYADQTWQLDSPGMQIPGGPGSAESSQSQGPVSSSGDLNWELSLIDAAKIEAVIRPQQGESK